MIRLLYITNGINGAGGLERVLSVKASMLVDQFGYEVHILSLNEPNKSPFYEFSPSIIFHSINVEGNPIKYFQSYVSGLTKKVKQINPDVISVCDDGLKGFFLPLLLRKPCPMIYERHVSKLIALNIQNSNGIKRIGVSLQFKIMDMLAKTFDAFVVLTDGNAKEWILPNLHVIGNPTSFYPNKSSGLLNTKVIAVGKHGYQKGYDRLLQIWKTVAQRHPEWKLEIYGKPEKNKKLEELAESLRITSSVRFYLPEKNVQEKYLDSSIYVMSSRYEGFGMVLIEAMACGVPCVSFDCPHGPADIIADGKDGFLVKNGDIDDFAEKIIQLIEDEELRKKLGATARENVKKYLPENIIPEWDHLIKTLTMSNHV